jgi:hypothetical protein
MLALTQKHIWIQIEGPRTVARAHNYISYVIVCVYRSLARTYALACLLSFAWLVWFGWIKFYCPHTKWKAEDDLAIKKEVIETFAAAESGKLPSGLYSCKIKELMEVAVEAEPVVL